MAKKANVASPQAHAAAPISDENAISFSASKWTTLSHGLEVYTADAKGVFRLPADNRWYQPLVNSGDLTPVPPSELNEKGEKSDV